MASGMWGVSLSCLRELFDGLISPSINVVNKGDQPCAQGFILPNFAQLFLSLGRCGEGISKEGVRDKSLETSFHPLKQGKGRGR